MHHLIQHATSLLRTHLEMLFSTFLFASDGLGTFKISQTFALSTPYNTF